MPASMHMTLEFRCRMDRTGCSIPRGSVSIRRIFEDARQVGGHEGTSLLDDRQKDTGVKILRCRHGILDLANARIEV